MALCRHIGYRPLVGKAGAVHDCHFLFDFAAAVQSAVGYYAFLPEVAGKSFVYSVIFNVSDNNFMVVDIDGGNVGKMRGVLAAHFLFNGFQFLSLALGGNISAVEAFGYG